MNEIVTYGQNYALNDGIKKFVDSAVKTGANVVVILNKVQPEVKEYILQYKNARCVNAEKIASTYNVDLNLSPYTLKVIFFYLYCKHLSHAENVFLCDFTDVFFNKDVFNKQYTKPVVFGEGVEIGSCSTNTTWINVCYNQDIFNLLKDYEIINGGAILGPKNKCADLLKEMCADISVILGRTGNYPNIDQAILNKVVRFDQHRYEIGSKNTVLNLAQYKELRKWSKENVPAVFHQYDGHLDVERFINEQS